MDAQTFFKKLDSIPDIPTLPSIVITVNKMLQDYDTSIKNLSKAIEKDQSMVTKILRLVNSTFYGFRSRIKNIPHAIIVLGFNTIRNAVVSVSVIKTFSEKDICEGVEIEEFWKHSVAVAVTSRYLAEQTRLDSPEDCFVSGLLHDIGKLVLYQY
ncbi:MAG: HDOD domain-containing protein, partial [Proteobacteria bacterium]|nr:HDOD domain-containing protein [Pseudomonadota bacterium]